MRLFFLMCVLLTSFACGSVEMPRTIVALYDRDKVEDISFTYCHLFAEMPLNHLGYQLYYHDINEGLPDLTNRHDVVGVFTWFTYPIVPKVNEKEYVRWVKQVFSLGKKFVVFGNPGIYNEDIEIQEELIREFWFLFDLDYTNTWITTPYNLNIIKSDPKMMNFERKFDGFNVEYMVMTPLNPKTTIHLSAKEKDNSSSESVLICTGSQGSFVASQCGIFENVQKDHYFHQWYLNPFVFFQLAFDTHNIPKPDTTTHAGNRIFYSQIDGDGWNNETEMPPYQKEDMKSSDVIYREILSQYPELPVTVAPIAAEIDLNWVGTNTSINILRKILNLSHIQTGCHTFTHPFDWLFFQNYKAEYEDPYLDQYRHGSWKDRSLWKTLVSIFYSKQSAQSLPSHNLGESLPSPTPSSDPDIPLLQADYELPRSYGLKPFELKSEVFGAISIINALAPSDKPVSVYQWSGNCLPFSQAIEYTRKAGVLNINGGDSRFDNNHPSYSWVRPIGRQCGTQYQIYTACSNENTYTDNWSANFYAFNQLPQTLSNTETPLRIKPINLYYHMFSGSKSAGVNAIKQNIAYIEEQEFIPLTTAHFAAIADGFRSTKISLIKPNQWKIENRGRLQTIRFDHLSGMQVDFTNSKGVIGQHTHQGSLYIFLDEEASDPLIALKNKSEITNKIPYLSQSRWNITHFKISEQGSIHFTTQGYGQGLMKWFVPDDGEYRITASFFDGSKTELTATTKNNLLEFIIGRSAIKPLKVSVERVQQ